ncbi:MAG: hypothetical protein WAS27_00190 [Candidatus Saccharimonadales bacterium]
MEREKPQQEHEGEKYLRLLGLEDIANEPIPGGTKQMRDFLDICGEHARPALVGLEMLDSDDPRRKEMCDALRTYVRQLLNSAES